MLQPSLVVSEEARTARRGLRDSATQPRSGLQIRPNNSSFFFFLNDTYKASFKTGGLFSPPGGRAEISALLAELCSAKKTN